MTFFQRLNAARKRLNDSVETACAKMRVSVSTWYKWRSGVVPRPVMRDAAHRYIKDAPSE